MKSLYLATCLLLLVCACDDGDRRTFSSPTSPGIPVEAAAPSPTPIATPVPSYIVNGVVYEVTPTGQVPIEGAWVTETHFHGGTYTGADGSYRLEGLPPGRNYIGASKDGYGSQGGEITITGELRLDFELVRQ